MNKYDLVCPDPRTIGAYSGEIFARNDTVALFQTETGQARAFERYPLPNNRKDELRQPSKRPLKHQTHMVTRIDPAFQLVFAIDDPCGQWRAELGDF